MKLRMEELTDLALLELDPRDPLEEEWFAERRSGSLPPPRSPSVPPMGDDDVDPWLR
jgi:hypothetical protein